MKTRAPISQTISRFRIQLVMGLVASVWLVQGMAADGSKSVSTSKPLEPRTPEQRLAYVLHCLPQYTEWPEATFADTNQAFVVGILGDDPFAKDADVRKGSIPLMKDEAALCGIWRYLGCKEYLRVKVGSNVVTRRVIVKRFTKLQEGVADCHLLFVDASEMNRLPDLLRALEGASTLTTAQMEGFVDRRGIINCVPEEKNGRQTLWFEINIPAAKKAKLRFSDQLDSLVKRYIRS